MQLRNHAVSELHQVAENYAPATGPVTGYMTSRLLRISAGLVFGTALLVGASLARGQANEPESPYGGTMVEDIIARVNDQIITKSDYDRALSEMDQEARQRGETMQEMAAARRELLRNLIDQQLWLSKGKELSITGETELVKRLDEIRKQYNLDTIEDLEKAAKEQGVSFEDFKANIRNQIITQEVMRQEVGEHIQMTPGEVERYYEGHKQDYAQPESVRLSEILISTGPEGADDPAKVAAAKAKADDIEARLHAGGDFAQLARSFSDGSTAASGRRSGAVQAGPTPKVLEDKTFDLKSGQYTDPILTRQGYIILKVVQHTPGGPRPFKEVEEDVEQAYYMSRMEPAIRAYLTKMRDEAFIEIKQGYVDTGATPAELHPSISFSAYVPPAPKKKAKVERTRFRESTAYFPREIGCGCAACRNIQRGADERAFRDTSTRDNTGDSEQEEGEQEARSSHREARQEREDPLWAGAARDAAFADDKLRHGECGRAAGDGLEHGAAGQSAGADRTHAEDALQRSCAAAEKAEGKRQSRANGFDRARAAECRRGCRPADAVGSFGFGRRHVNQKEEEDVECNRREDASGKSEEEPGRIGSEAGAAADADPACAWSARAGGPSGGAATADPSIAQQRQTRGRSGGPGNHCRARIVFGTARPGLFSGLAVVGGRGSLAARANCVNLLGRMKDIYIADLMGFDEGKLFDSFFLVLAKQQRTTKQNKPYLNLMLGDKTGQIEGRVWELGDPRIARDFERGDMVKVRGSVSRYDDRAQAEGRSTAQGARRRGGQDGHAARDEPRCWRVVADARGERRERERIPT